MESESKELRGAESQFPVDVRQPTPLNVHEWSGYDRDTPLDKTAFSFGVDPKMMADSLRRIADRIESGEYKGLSGSLHQVASHDDYHMTCVVIRFHQTKPPIK